MNEAIRKDLVYNSNRSSHFEKMENFVNKVPEYTALMK